MAAIIQKAKERAGIVMLDTSELTVLRTSRCSANVELSRRGLATFTFGNASAIDRAAGRRGDQAERRSVRRPDGGAMW